MKISEALREVKSLKGRLARAWALVEQNSYYPRGKDRPAFDVRSLLADIAQHTEELRALKIRVQKANQVIRVGPESLAEAIIHLDDLRGEVARLERIFRHRPPNRYQKDEEVIYDPVVPEPEQVEAIEAVGRRIEEVDNAIQRANWTHDLPD